jgi:ATP-dependent DNA helicase RecQ
VPPYIVFSDVALRQMAREYPMTLETFGLIHGVGDKKLKEFGDMFTAEIEKYLEDNPRQEFAA